MSRSVWKGPFVDPSLLKKVEKLKINLITTNKNLVKKIYNYSRICWNKFFNL